jgi:hypothetical protein
MARFSAAPRQGHMVNVIHIFCYCKKHLDSKIVFDPAVKDFDNIQWLQFDWKQFYPDIHGDKSVLILCHTGTYCHTGTEGPKAGSFRLSQ